MGALSSTPPQVVSLPAGCTSNAGNTTYTFWIKGTLRTAAAGLTGILGTSVNTNSNGFAMNATLQLRVYTAGQNRYGTGDNFFEVGVYHHYRIEHDAGGAWRAYRDDMVTPVASGTFTFSTVFSSLNQIFRSSSASTMYGAWDLEELGVTSTTFNETYNADLSGGVGDILPTVSGNNQGTLNTPLWPSDDSQWIGFGATVSASIAATMPQMSAAIAGSVIAPAFSASIAFSMPQMQVTATSSVVAPELESVIAFSMPQFAADASASVVAPSSGAVVSFVMPQMEIDAAASSTVPVFSASAAFAMPQFAVSASANAPSLNVAASIAAVMPQMSVSAAAVVSNPAISAAISFTMPQVVVTAYTGGFAYFESGDANINTPALSTNIDTAALSNSIEIPELSRNIEYMAQSRHLEYTTQSRHIEWRA